MDAKTYTSRESRLLLVTADPSLPEIVRKALSEHAAFISAFEDLQTALKVFENESFTVALLDLTTVPLEDGKREVDIRRIPAHCPLVLISQPEQTHEALALVREGADDILLRPLSLKEIAFTLEKAYARDRLRRENQLLKAEVSKRFSCSNIIGQSPAMTEIFETVRKIAEYKTSVMLLGESGTGKELIARAIHVHSPRRNRPFVGVNCAAIPENLLESELFGHKKGAFTDATRDKKGLFEEAEGGTVLLDEVGELPLHLQVKLLRVLQENEVRPVGDNRAIPIDVRVIAATLRNIENDVLEGKFRDDLFYRLNVVTIRIPPLRERREDIPLLVNFFIKRNREKLGLPVYGIEKDALAVLLEHSWPGNIRELENCIERAMILTEGESITVESLPSTVRPSRGEAPAPPLFEDSLSIKLHTRILEENLIRRALIKTGGNRTHAAKVLEISHRALLYKLKEYGLGNESGNTPRGGSSHETQDEAG